MFHVISVLQAAVPRVQLQLGGGDMVGAGEIPVSRSGVTASACGCSDSVTSLLGVQSVRSSAQKFVKVGEGGST